jgi:hypothetical protein
MTSMITAAGAVRVCFVRPAFVTVVVATVPS